MNIVLDANILCRLIETAHAHHQRAKDAIAAIETRGDQPVIFPQILYETWVVSTRPIRVNGLGKSAHEMGQLSANFKVVFPLLHDTPAIFPEWERLVIAHQVLGKNAHDARLAAAMLVHGVTHILTFNGSDFSRFQGITAIDPASVFVAPPTP